MRAVLVVVASVATIVCFLPRGKANEGRSNFFSRNSAARLRDRLEFT